MLGFLQIEPDAWRHILTPTKAEAAHATETDSRYETELLLMLRGSFIVVLEDVDGRTDMHKSSRTVHNGEGRTQAWFAIDLPTQEHVLSMRQRVWVDVRARCQIMSGCNEDHHGAPSDHIKEKCVIEEKCVFKEKCVFEKQISLCLHCKKLYVNAVKEGSAGETFAGNRALAIAAWPVFTADFHEPVANSFADAFSDAQTSERLLVWRGMGSGNREDFMDSFLRPHTNSDQSLKDLCDFDMHCVKPFVVSVSYNSSKLVVYVRSEQTRRHLTMRHQKTKFYNTWINGQVVRLAQWYYSLKWEVTWWDLDPPTRLACPQRRPTQFPDALEIRYVIATSVDTSGIISQ
ncbi:hypothetical protein Plhal304r1_c016g0058531 [Plasmopara halstedii]